MKTKKLFILLTALLALSACGDDEDQIIISGGGHIGGNGSSNSSNVNKNTSGPIEARTHYEFPKLNDGNSEVVVHSTTEYGMTYALEWDHSKKATRWVCWEMDASNRQERYSRSQLYPNGDPWDYDPFVPTAEQQSTYSELSKSYYPGTKSYYQRGHICASQDRIYDKEANMQTFYMTNIMPMVGNFNGKLWAKLEGQVRTWGKTADTLYICKGGTIDRSEYILDYTIGGHIVPKYYWMALFSKKSVNVGGKYEASLSAIGFWMKHLDEDHSNDKLSQYAITIDRLEELTGIDFFCNLPDDIENEYEKKLTLSDWNLK